MNKEKLLKEFTKHFGENSFIAGNSPLAIFKPICPEFGEIKIWLEDEEVTMKINDSVIFQYDGWLPDMTDEEVENALLSKVIEFLQGVFTDKYLFFRVLSNNTVFFNKSDRNGLEEARKHLNLSDPKLQWCFWSGPIDK